MTTTHDLRFSGLIRLCLVGPSSCGKTFFLYKLLRHAQELMSLPPKKIIFFYQAEQPLYEEMKDYFKNLIVFVKGLPSDEKLKELLERERLRPLFLVLDDFSLQLNETVTNLFQVLSHHHSLHVAVLTQSLFSKNKQQRDITLNSTHLVLFKNPRDRSVATSLGRQFAPGHAGDFSRVYEEATREPHSYLMINLQQNCPDHLRLVSRIYPDQWPMRVWVPASWAGDEGLQSPN